MELSSALKILTEERERLKSESSLALQWARDSHVNSRGEKMRFDKMDYLTEMYQEIGTCPRYVVEKAVQTGISELCIIQSHLEAANFGLTVMYVLPKYELRNRFVNNRVYKLHRRAPEYRKLIKSVAGGTHRVSLIHLGAGTLAYVGSNVEDEFIEIPVDSAFVDEKDRCNAANLLLLPDRYSASPYQFHREISNPTIEGYGIDERFLESTQGLWYIRCPHCNTWFVPDWFTHFVREVGPGQYEVRDPEWELGKEPRMIHSCGKAVDRLSAGAWVDTYRGREWVGRRISRLFSKSSRIKDLVVKWNKAQGNDLKIQVFYNSDLGLPFTSKGSKITRSMLEACCRQYDWPMTPGKTQNIRIMGVDVGAELHIVIRDVIRQGGASFFRLMAALTVPSFELLGGVIREWSPRFVVVDALPEIHKVMELKSAFSQVYASQFQQDARKISINRDNREVRMDRTALLDYVKQGFDVQTFLLPKAAQFIDNGQYYTQLCESTRILDVDEKNPEKSRFAWVHTNPDHYFLAEAYCFQAALLLPSMEAFEFFEAEAARMNAPSIQEIKGLTQEERQELERLSGMDAQAFLRGIKDRYTGGK